MQVTFLHIAKIQDWFFMEYPKLIFGISHGTM